MSPLFRKKPIVVEAVQYLPHDTCADVAKLLGLHHSPKACEADKSGRMEWIIETSEGAMVVSPGDWVIRGTRGEFYPCKPGPFEDTFEEVIETSSEALPEKVAEISMSVRDWRRFRTSGRTVELLRRCEAELSHFDLGEEIRDLLKEIGEDA